MKRTTVVIGMACAALAAIAGFGAAPVSADSATANRTPVMQDTRRFDGRAIFRGVFAQDGPVAAVLDVPVGKPSDPTAQRARVTTHVMDAIEKADPGFFGRFAAWMQSGNPQKVRQAMGDARDRIAEVAHKQRPTAKLPPPFIYQYFHIYEDTYLYQYQFGVQYVLIYQVGAWWSSAESPSDRGLKTDAGIAALAAALKK